MSRKECVWTADLLYLLGLLAVSERAARSTLLRMARNDWFKRQKQGRLSQYCITSGGKTLLEQGNERIFEPPLPPGMEPGI